MEYITVIVKPPMRPAYQTVVKNTLEALQGLVGGYIETVPVGKALMLVNEEGKLRGLPVNLALGPELIVGPAVFVGVDGDEFVSCPVSWADLSQELDDLWEVR